MSVATYYIDGVNFTTYGVHVSRSEGLLSRPKFKKPQSLSWQGHHGEVVDLSKKYYEAREIKLTCFVVASDQDDFIAKTSNFLALFDAVGTRRLMVDAGATKNLFFEVYLDNPVDIDKTWTEGQMAGTFILTLREPVPVKRVYSITGSSVSFTITSSKVLDIFWGDGQSNTDVFGTGLVVSHNYAVSGTYYIIVAGDLEAISSISTSATQIWSRL